MKKKKWFLYIILTEKNKLYTGITTDLERRFLEHKNLSGAKFFYSDKPLKIVYQESFSNRSLASKRECEIKKLKRAQKLKLIENYSSSS